MALKSDGLSNIGMGAGFTTNFHVQYETGLFDALPAAQANVVKANLIANANALLAVIENEFNVTTGWFNTPAGKFGTGQRQVVKLNLADGSGANNSGYGNPINLDAQSGNANAAQAAGIVQMVYMNEWVEILMSLSSGKWNAGDSSGEGLSQYCGIVRFQTGHYNYYGSWVDQWLNTTPRQDWVTTTKGNDGDVPSFGCALGFIYYLNTQLNFSINQIIAAGAANLATVYKTLTGDSGNPYPFFADLLEHVYPSSATANIPGPVIDNPFPLARMSFWMNKNSFGKDEVQDVLNTSGGKWKKSFWLIVEGFSKNSFNALGITVAAFTGPFTGLAGISISQNPDIDFENAANPQTPQRIRIPFDIKFTNAALADFPGAGSQTYELDASLKIGGSKVPGSDTSTRFELLAGADPYFTNIDPAQNNVFYLSQDLRVFTATPGKNPTPVPGAPAFTVDNSAGAYQYMQGLLNWLNNPANHFTDGNVDPFVSGVIPQPGDALNGDSSVTPFTYEFKPAFPPVLQKYNNYNFALARVRLRGSAGPSGAAKNVRVFFRLWSTETADTDYQTGSTYPSTPDAAGLPGWPLVGSDHHTLPCFASGDLTVNADYNPGGANIRDIQIPTVPAGRDSVWAYYGCFLNIFDANNKIDGKPVQAWLNGTHHCIVAQIAADDAPVIPGSSPENTDKLAQRNLQVTFSDNPGPAATHRIPQTFDLRPSAAVGIDGASTAYPDELMIDWGGIPVGSVASIYWPQVQVADVLTLATKLYSSNALSSSDAHTLQCKITGGVSYIPIPPGGSENFAGLFTVDLPTMVVTGQEFNIVVRRIATRETQPPVILHTHSLPTNIDPHNKIKPKPLKNPDTKKGDSNSGSISWRYVVGTFSVKIPVTTGEVMLFPEENTLAIMKWRLQQMLPSNRWYPVLERYIGYIAGRIDGLGGNSVGILPSPDGVPPKMRVHSVEHSTTGKVCEVLYDCFGDFEGFVLSDCHDSNTFKTRRRGIEEIVLRACREGLLLTVFTTDKHHRHICKLVIHC